jgi:hypothetical protein
MTDDLTISRVKTAELRSQMLDLGIRHETHAARSLATVNSITEAYTAIRSQLATLWPHIVAMPELERDSFLETTQALGLAAERWGEAVQEVSADIQAFCILGSALDTMLEQSQDQGQEPGPELVADDGQTHEI